MAHTLKRSGKKLLPALMALAAFFVYGCGSSDIAGDGAPPQSVALSVNNGKSYTTSQTVSVSMSATDNVSINAYYISESPNVPAPDAQGWVDVQPTRGYTGTATYELSSGYGDKKLYVWFRDTSSNVSAASSAIINLAFVAPDVASPNVVMIVVDTLRADHLSLYGYSRDTAPNISAFADSAVLFENAYSAAPWTLPSFASMLLGKMAYNHDYNAPIPEPTTERMLPNLLQDHGYHTVSVQTNYFVPYLHEGFDEKADYSDENIGFNDAAAANYVISWLNNRSNRDRSFFLFIGLISPHWPYKTTNGFLSNFVMDQTYTSSPRQLVTFPSDNDGIITYASLPADLQAKLGAPSNGQYYMDSRLYIAAYDSEIRYSDEQIGRILSTLKSRGLYDNSIVIITSDHGENMVEHNTYFTHGNNLYNSLLRVPLLIKFPGQTSARSVSADVRNIDILPTVLDYDGIDAGDIDGKSLLPVVNDGNVDFSQRPIISYLLMNAVTRAGMASLVRDDYKLIKNPGIYELYDIKTDRDETYNLAASEGDRVDDLDAYLMLYYPY